MGSLAAMLGARRLSALVLLAATASAVLPACSGDDDRLVIYSGRTQDLVGPLLERFAEEHDVKIDVRYGDSAELALLIEEEGEDTPADVFLSQSPGAVGFLDANGRLQEIPAEILDSVDSEFEAGDGTWIGLSGRVRTLVYNTDAVDPDDLPDSVLDLTDPEWRGRVAVAPTNGSFQDFVTALRTEVGDDVATEWLEGMEANDSPTYPNNLA
ncbi:MAG: extracellular solute-binding protein, partial [Acidimicrobiia bacterium]